MSSPAHCCFFAALGASLLAGSSRAGASTDQTVADPLAEVVVIGATPVPGLLVDADKVPGNVQTLFSEDLKKDGITDLTAAMNSQLGSVSINDTLADPFQPDIFYRGFAASPVLGTQEGLAVYQNGVRINEAFGDSVNWDLIPDIAISRIDLLSSSPLYGLNALGGALCVTMKNGFNYQGLGAELAGGSFNRHSGETQFGFDQGMFGFYAAARQLHQDGWRTFAQDAIKQYYLTVSLHDDDGLTVDLSYSRANNHLYGQGAAPVQSLAVDRRNIFTGPQHNINNVDFVTLDSTHGLTKKTALQSVVYFRNYRQTVANGSNSDFTACSTDQSAGALCQEDGVTPLTNAAGTLIPDISNGGANIIGQNDFESIHSQSWGGSLQFASTAQLADHGNTFAVGATIDTATTNFISGAEVGPLDASLAVLPTGLFVDTPEGGDHSATPVLLNATNKYYGFFATDSFDVDRYLSLTLSGRYNIAKVDLSDLRGSALNGHNRFTHFNPAFGATYKLTPSVTMFAGYSTNNRAPTASEIECSDPLRPCLLPSNLAGDPPNLQQVISHTAEVGARGRIGMTHNGMLSWNASVFNTRLGNDIYGVATTQSSGFFENIGSTRRQGLETGVTYRDQHWTVYAQYSYIDATFQSALRLNSPSNPFQDENGNIHVSRGDHLPGSPKNRIKAGADYALLTHWSIGGSVSYTSSSFYHGDEANQNPTLPGFTVASLRAAYRITPTVEFFATLQNLFDRKYSTYGLFGDPTGVGAPGIPAAADPNDPGVDNRFQSPAMPRTYFGGVRIKF